MSLIKTLRQARNQCFENQGITPPHIHGLNARSAFDRSLFKMQRMGRALALGLGMALLPNVAAFAQQEEDPEAQLVCLEIHVVDLNSNSGMSDYGSANPGNYPNTINICQSTEFEISDDPSVSEGRCFVPFAEGAEQWYLLYLMTTNQNAALPTIGTVVPQSTGDWNVVLNAGNIPNYNQNNFGPGIYQPFSISTPGAYAVIGVICELNGNNDYEIISVSGSGPTDPVSEKVYINYLDPNQNLSISGAQHLCEGASDVYSIPANLAGFNPVWTVTGGTFTGSGTNIQVNWTIPFAGTRSVSVTVEVGEGLCEQTGTLLVFDCCTIDGMEGIVTSNAAISTTPFSGLGTANPNNSGYAYIVVNGFLHIDENIELDNIQLFMGPYSRITVADGVHFEASNLAIIAICNIMFDGVYASSDLQRITLNNVNVSQSINGLISEKGGRLEVYNSSLEQNYVGVNIRDYNPINVSNYNGNLSPLEMYGTTFKAGGALLPPYQGSTAGRVAVKVTNTGFVKIGVRNQLPNLFNPNPGATWSNMETGISLFNSGGNIVNNHFFKNNVVGSPSQSGAILAATGTHASWISPLQIGRLWSGGAAGDANYFELGYQAVRTTNVQSVFIRENVFKDFSSNITVINAAFQRVIQFNQINYQLGSTATPNRSASGIVVSSTHGVPTNGGIVSNNHVEACSQGILTTTVNSMTVINNEIRTFSADNVSQLSIRSGISATNGWNINIYKNNLLHNNLPINSSLTGDNLRGINLNFVLDAFVWDNYIRRYGAGVYAGNDNRGSQFRCNIFSATIWGFNFRDVILSQQGEFGNPSDNQWEYHRTSIRTQGNHAPNPVLISWYYRNGFAFNPEPISQGLNSHIDPINIAGAVFECAYEVKVTDSIGNEDKYDDPEVVETLLAPIADSSSFFHSEYVQYFEESMAYRILDENPSIILQTQTHQQVLSDFYAINQVSEKGKVKNLYDALLSHTTSNYEQVILDFQPSNIFETKIAEVNAIYAQSWAKGRFELDSIERGELMIIALAEPTIWGEAVYTARVMLGMFDLDENVGASMQRRAINEVIFDEKVLGNAYPNPTNGSFGFEGTLQTGTEKASIVLFDLQGRPVSQPDIQFVDGTWLVLEPQVTSGLYIYRLTIDGTEVQNGKIIIQ